MPVVVYDTDKPIVVGAEYTFLVYTENADYDFRSTPVELIIDSPKALDPPVRKVLRHLGGGPDRSTQNGTVVAFKLPPSETAAMALGSWQVTPVIGALGVDAKAPAPRMYSVITLINGGLPQS